MSETRVRQVTGAALINRVESGEEMPRQPCPLPDVSTRPRALERRAHKDPSRGDDDCVRRWLAQIESDTNQDEALAAPHFSDQDRARSKGARVEFPFRRTPLDSANAAGASKRKRKHDSSSDSSLLEVPIRPQSHSTKRDDHDPRPVPSRRPKDQPTTPREKQRVVASDSRFSSQSAAPSYPKKTFEKRARHKTREDRYEPKKKEGKKKRTHEEKPARKKRERRGESKKAAKKAGEELISTFSSKNISQDRLTMRPSHGLGLFNNGRASSPARRRGLPDLAFSEMHFLQRPRTHQHVEDTGDKSKPRSREREKKKVSRVQDEISDFFKPNRVPLQEVSSNQGGSSSEIARKEHSLYAKQLESERDARIHEPSKPLSSRPELIGRIQAKPPSDRHQAVYSYNTSPGFTRSMGTPDATSRDSGKATTYVSWSKSHRSPALTSLHSNFERTPLSVTPESIRRSIENTGIFRDTGIKKDGNLDRAGASPSMCERQVAKSQSNERTPTGMTNSSDVEAEGSEAYLYQKEEILQDFSRENDRHELLSLPDNLPSAAQVDTNGQHGTSRTRFVTEHFDPTIGWRETPMIIECSQQTPAPAMQSKPTPLSREQIAKNARVKMPKRPSTTVPVIRDTGNENSLSHEEELDNRKSIVEAGSLSQCREDFLRAGNSSIYAKSARRPLLSRLSNPSLPTIYEDAHEYSPRPDEAPVAEVQPSSTISHQASQPRLNLTWNNNPSLPGSQFQPQPQGSDYTLQDMNQNYESNDIYHVLPVRGAWMGNYVGGTTVGLPPMGGAQSLFLRQMQGHTPAPSRRFNSPTYSVTGSSWESSGLEPSAYDDHGHQKHQKHAELTEYAHEANHHNHPAARQEYDGGIDHFDVEGFNEPEVWHSEANDVGRNWNSYNHMLEDQKHYYENENTYEEQDLSEPHGQSIEYGGYDPQAEPHHNVFWQPYRRY